MAISPHPTDQEYKTYGTFQVKVSEGTYTLEELEKLLARCREMKYRFDESLKKSMDIPHKKFNDRIGMLPFENAVRIFGRNQ